MRKLSGICSGYQAWHFWNHVSLEDAEWHQRSPVTNWGPVRASAQIDRAKQDTSQDFKAWGGSLGSFREIDLVQSWSKDTHLMRPSRLVRGCLNQPLGLAAGSPPFLAFVCPLLIYFLVDEWYSRYWTDRQVMGLLLIREKPDFAPKQYNLIRLKEDPQITLTLKCSTKELELRQPTSIARVALSRWLSSGLIKCTLLQSHGCTQKQGQLKDLFIKKQS